LKKQIFYFTGTGNCLSIARKLNGLLKDYTLHSIVSDFKLSEDNIERELIIVAPVYMYNIPYIVRSFMEKLNDIISSK
jgi:flavodoxin